MAVTTAAALLRAGEGDCGGRSGTIPRGTSIACCLTYEELPALAAVRRGRTDLAIRYVKRIQIGAVVCRVVRAQIHHHAVDSELPGSRYLDRHTVSSVRAAGLRSCIRRPLAAAAGSRHVAG